MPTPQTYVSATIYAKHGDNARPHGSVGISFPPTPSLTYIELLDIISQLNAVERNMRNTEQ